MVYEENCELVIGWTFACAGPTVDHTHKRCTHNRTCDVDGWFPPSSPPSSCRGAGTRSGISLFFALCTGGMAIPLDVEWTVNY